MTPEVVVIGGASINTIVTLDRLPDPRPHTITAQRHDVALGGTSAGKALHLASLGRETLCVVAVGNDSDANRILEALDVDHLTTIGLRAEAPSEHHLNLMTPSGQRLSIYLDHAPTVDVPAAQRLAIANALHDASVTVLDLSEIGRQWLDEAAGCNAPVVVDVHDYDGVNPYHDPFLAAADLVFMNDDGMDDPVPFLRDRAARGALLAVCTMGSRGALAVGRGGAVIDVPAAPATVVDTNGAGDAFVAGVIDHLISTSQLSNLDAPAIREALAAGARQAAIAVGVRGVGPNSKL